MAHELRKKGLRYLIFYQLMSWWIVYVNRIKNVSHIYDDGQVTEALRNINLTIREREFIGLVGHTGSGKSTLVQLLNGLIKPSTGTITIDGLNITEGKTSLLGIRRKIGLVFQYPEHQLFEETIYGDVAFGPRNLQLEEEEVEIRVRKPWNW